MSARTSPPSTMSRLCDVKESPIYIRMIFKSAVARVLQERKEHWCIAEFSAGARRGASSSSLRPATGLDVRNSLWNSERERVLVDESRDEDPTRAQTSAGSLRKHLSIVSQLGDCGNSRHLRCESRTNRDSILDAGLGADEPQARDHLPPTTDLCVSFFVTRIYGTFPAPDSDFWRVQTYSHGPSLPRTRSVVTRLGRQCLQTLSNTNQNRSIAAPVVGRWRGQRPAPPGAPT